MPRKTRQSRNSRQPRQPGGGFSAPGFASASLQQQKHQAMELIGARRYGEAQRIYERLLDSGLADAQVCANLAALHQIAGRSAASIPLLERAIALQPAYPEALLNLGNALQTTRRSKEAITAFCQAIALNPALPEAHTGLGVALQDQGQLEEAIGHHREALRLRPAYAAAWSNLGVALRNRGDCRKEAIAAFREALRLQPHYPEALSNLGIALLGDGQIEAGLACQREAITLNPKLAAPHLHLGDGLRELHRLPEAMAAYRTAIQCQPEEARAYAGLAMALMDFGDLEQGLLVAEQGMAIRPDWLPTHWVKIKILEALRRPDEALEASETLLQHQPDSALGYLAQAALLETLKRYTEAHAALDRALQLDSSLSAAYYTRGWMWSREGQTQAAIDAFRKALALKPASYEAACGLFFTALFSRGAQGSLIRADAEQFWAGFPIVQTDPFPARAPLAAQALASTAPIRLLLLSGDIGDHAVSCFLEPLLRGLDRRRFQLVLALSHRRREARARELEQLAGEVVDLTGLGEAEAVALLRRQGCAVLIETSGWTAHNRLPVLRHRVAPVQCHYVGFCGTTGLASIDYLIGDAVLTPPQLQNQFTEQLWVLPRCWSAYVPTFTPPPLTDRPEGTPITFGSFNNLLKLTDRCADFWAAALRAVPAARMMIKDGSALEPSVQSRVRRQLESRGVEPERLNFVGHVADWHAHMDLYNQVDIALDTTPMTSATTGFEALCMGVPLLAIQSDWMGGRMSSSALTALGRANWISREPDAFAAQASELAAAIECQPNQLKRQLHQQVRSSPLWDGASLCRALEQAFEEMLQQCAVAGR